MGDYDDYRGDNRSSSRYDDGPRRYKNTKTRPRRDDDADFVEETTFIERGKGRPPQELVYRGRDRDDSVEDITRDFSPPAGRRPRGYEDYGGPQRRSRSVASRRNRYDDDDSDDYGSVAAGAGGAAAGYAVGRSGRNRGYGDDRRGSRRQDSYYSDDDYNDRPREEKRKKSGIESTLEGLGLGGVAGALLGNKDKERSRSRDGRGGRDRSRPRGQDKQREWAQAAQAALIAGAVEAFRSRGAPGPWTGDKGKRIATAAIGAGGIDKLVDRDPNDKSKRHLVEAVLGGLAANRLANGPPRSASKEGSRSRSSSQGGRSRSRSVFSRYRKDSRGRRGSSDDEARGTTQSDKFKDLAAGGVLAGVGKQIYDRFRSKSRKRRSPSASGSEDSYRSRSRRGNRDVGAYSQSRGGPSDEGAVVGPRGRGGAAAANGGGSQADKEESNRVGEGSRNDPNGGKDNSSSSDSLSSTDMEDRRKKMRGKEYLTAALASIATIHAAHGVYQSMEASDKRHKLVAEGEMTPEEARKKRSKAWLQDAAAVGIAALGIKGSYSEWKEMNEQRHEIKELEERKRAREKRKKKRLEMGLPPVGPTGRTNGRYAPGRFMSGANGNGDGYGGGGGGGGRDGSRRPRDDDQYYDGNPYGGGRLPPPPTGYNR